MLFSISKSPCKILSELVVLLLIDLACATCAVAQIPAHPASPVGASATAAAPVDPLGRDTPRGTVVGFIRAAQSENYEVAVQYFEIRRRGAPEPDTELAAQLLAILNARFVGSLDAISNDPLGRSDDGLPHETVMVGGTRGFSESFPLYLVHSEPYFQPPGVPRGTKLWLISRQTLEQVPEVYDSLRFPQLEKKLPGSLVKVRLLSMPLWQWMAILLFAFLALFLGWLAGLLTRFCRQLIRRARGLPPLPREPLRRFGPGTVLVAVLFHYYSVYLIGASLLYRQYYQKVILILLSVASYWALTRLTYWISLRVWNRLTERGLYAERSLISLTRRVLDVGIFVIIGLWVLSSLDANVPAALAGLGIGGLAIGLGAQKTFENLLGGISILTDRALLVGDPCRIGDQRGVVEDIGLRSTKLRTEERTLVSIPNGTVATATLENYRWRDKILCKQVIRLRYDLSPDHLRYVVEQLRDVMTRHPKVEEASARVRVLRLGENAIEVEVYGYILSREYGEFLAVQEDLILQLMDTLEKTGGAVALPSQTTVVTQDAWVDPQKAAAAHRAVEKSRDPGVPGMQRPELAPDIVPPKQ
jgi:MscS family membrane protein